MSDPGRSIRSKPRPEALGPFVHRTFSSLGVRNFRLWFVGQSISMVGYFAQTVAQALLVLELTDDGTLLGVVAALQFSPILIVGPFAGVLSDRHDKRRLLLVTQGTMMIAASTLALLTLTDRVTFALVAIVTLVTGTAFAFDQPARRTIVTELVGPEQASNAVSLNSAVVNLTKILGPAAAGVLVTSVGVGWCFALNASSFIAVLAALAAMDDADIHRPELLERGQGQIREGFRYVMSTRDARFPLILVTLVAVTGFNWNVVMPLLALRELDQGSGGFAVIMGAMSAGSVAGTLWLARRSELPSSHLAVAAVLFGISSCLLAAARSMPATCGAAALVGATSMVLLNGTVVKMQLRTPQHLRGRVMAVFSMAFLGCMAVGSPLSGALAEAVGARGAILCGGAVALIVGTAGFIARSSPRDQERWGTTAVASTSTR